MSMQAQQRAPADDVGATTAAVLVARMECQAAVKRLHERSQQSGLNGILEDQAGPDEFDALLEQVVRARERLLSAARRRPSGRPSGACPLTGRQLEILRLVADGVSTGEIASRLYLSRATVRNHVAATLRALEAHSRIEAVAIARRRGLLAEPEGTLTDLAGIGRRGGV